MQNKIAMAKGINVATFASVASTHRLAVETDYPVFDRVCLKLASDNVKNCSEFGAWTVFVVYLPMGKTVTYHTVQAFLAH